MDTTATYRALADFSALRKEAAKTQEDLRKLRGETAQGSTELRRAEDSHNRFAKVLATVTGVARQQRAENRQLDASYRDMITAQTNAERAIIRVKDATRQAAQAQSEHGRTSDQFVAATRRQREAMVEMTRATERHEDAQRKLKRTEAGLGGGRASGGDANLRRFVTNAEGASTSALRVAGSVGLAATKLVAMASAAGPAAGALGAVAGAAGGLLSTLGPLASALSVMPQLLGGLIQGIGVTVLGFSGIGDALKQMGEAQTAGAAEGKKFAQAQVDSDRAVRDSQRSLRDARENQALGAEQAAERMRNAEESVSAARENAGRVAEQSSERMRNAQENLAAARENAGRVAEQSSERMRNAEESLANAQESALDAQENLNDARKDALRSLQDLERQVARAHLSEAGAALSAKEAAEEYQRVMNDPTSTTNQRERARLAYEESKLQLADTKRQNKENAEELAEAQRKGIEGSDQVVQAQRSVRDANEAVADAQKNIADTAKDNARAQADAAKSVVEAQRNIADTAKDNARAQADASKAVSEAERNVAQTAKENARAARQDAENVARAQEGVADALRKQTEIMEAGTPSAKKLADAMAKLSPAGKEFVTTLFAMKAILDKMRATAQENMLPGFTSALKSIKESAPFLEMVEKIIADTAKAIGDFVAQLGRKIVTPEWIGFLAEQGASNVRIFKVLSGIFLDLMDVVRVFMTAASPLLEWMVGVGKNADGSARGLRAWVDQLKKSFDTPEKARDLAAFFGENGPVRKAMVGWGNILKNTWDSLRSILKMSQDFGFVMLGKLEGLTKAWDTALGKPENQDRFKRFLNDSLPALEAMGHFVGELAKAMGRLAENGLEDQRTIWMTLADTFVPALERFLGSFQSVFPSIVRMISNLMEVLANLSESATGGGLKVFIDVLGGIVSGLVAITNNPIGANAIGSIVAFAAAIKGLSIAYKLSGIPTIASGINAAREALAKLAAKTGIIKIGVEAAGGAASGGANAAANFATGAATNAAGNAITEGQNKVATAASTAAAARLGARAGATSAAAGSVRIAGSSAASNAGFAAIGASAVANMKSYGEMASAAVAKVKGLVSAIGGFAAKMGVALAAAWLLEKGLTRLTDALGGGNFRAPETIENLTKSLQKLAKTGDMKSAEKDLGDLNDMIRRVSENDGTEWFADSWGEALDQFAGSLRSGDWQAAAKNAEEKFKALDEALGEMAASGNLDEAERSFAQIRDEMLKQGMSIEDVTRLFPKYEQAAREAQAKEFTEGIERAEAATAEAKDEVRRLINELSILNGEALDVQATQDALALAMLEAKDAANQNTAGLDGNTTAGLNNRTEMRNMITAANDHIQALVNEKAAQGDVSGALDIAKQKQAEHKEQLILAAMQMTGASREAAETYVTALLKSDRDFTAKIGEVGMAETQAKARGLEEEILRITGKKYEIRFNLSVNEQLALANLVRAGVEPRLAESLVKQEAAQANRGRATGGPVFGPGGPTEDKIPVWLSNGEYVIKADSVKKLGINTLDQINQGKLPNGAGRFAEGGLIRGTQSGVDGLFGAMSNINERKAQEGLTNLVTAGMAMREAARAAAAAAAAANSAPGGGGDAGGPPGALAAYNNLVALGHQLRGKGFRVTEHPAFGGVRGGHSPGSYHYKGRAIDVNYGPGGENDIEKRAIDALMPQLNGIRFAEKLWRVRGHFNHLHLAMAKGGLVPNQAGCPQCASGMAQHLNSGGQVGHAGRSSKDTVPAMLTPGEFVVRKEVVDKVGLNTMQVLNQGNVKPPLQGSNEANEDLIQRFAAGGVVAHSEVTLRSGSRGTAVRTLQSQLNAQGFNSGAVDGIFGPITTGAVKRMQAARGIGVDGIFGQQSRQALFHHGGGGISRVPSGPSWRPEGFPLAEGQQGPTVAQVQKFLGVAQDGKFGPQTRDALLNWQRQLGYPASGMVGGNDFDNMYDRNTGEMKKFPFWPGQQRWEWDIANLQHSQGDLAHTGVMDGPTVDRIKAYQKGKGWAENGILDEYQLNRMRSQTQELDAAIDEADRRITLNREWEDGLVKITAGGNTDLAQWLQKMGPSEGMTLLKQSIASPAQAAAMNRRVQDEGLLLGDMMPDVLKMVQGITSSTSLPGLKDMSAAVGAADWHIVKLWDKAKQLILRNSPAGKLSKLESDIALFKQGLYYGAPTVMGAASTAQGFAAGGRVPGQGSGDVVPAMLTPGEFVLRKAAVDAIGLSALMQMNTEPQKFAVGGPVMPMSFMPAQQPMNFRPAGVHGGTRPSEVANNHSTVVNNTFNTTINNPREERGTESVAKMLTRKAQLGVLSGPPS